MSGINLVIVMTTTHQGSSPSGTPWRGSRCEVLDGPSLKEYVPPIEQGNIYPINHRAPFRLLTILTD